MGELPDSAVSLVDTSLNCRSMGFPYRFVSPLSLNVSYVRCQGQAGSTSIVSAAVGHCIRFGDLE